MKHGKLKESLISLDFNDQQNAKSQSRSTQKLQNFKLYEWTNQSHISVFLSCFTYVVIWVILDLDEIPNKLASMFWRD